MPLGTILFCMFICSFSMPLRAEKVKTVPLKTGIRDLIEKSLKRSNRKKIRLAVLPFSSTGDTPADATSFGEYFADQLITAFSKKKECVLYERGRLDALGKELALNLTGLIDEKAAKQIGDMVPIDYLMTGTYTRLKSSIEINARLLDVITGEIKYGYTGKIKLTRKLLALFPEETPVEEPVRKDTPAITEEDNGRNCDALIKKARVLIQEKKHSSLIALAEKHPVTSPCGEIHYQVIDYLIDIGIFDNSYKKWLMKQLQMLSEPDRERTTVGSILRYFSADGKVDDTEWKSFTDMLRYSHKRNRSFYVRVLFRTDDFFKTTSHWRSRMDAYISTIPLPDEPVNSSSRAAAFMFLQPLSIESAPSEHYRYWLQKHLDKISGKESQRFLEKLTKEYAPSYIINVDSANFITALEDIILCHKGSTPCEKNALTTHYFIKKLIDATSERFRDEWRPFFARQLDHFMKECRESITRQYKFIPQNLIEYCTGYCLKYDIRVPGKIPSINEVVEKIKDPDIRVRTGAAELLAEAGSSTLPVAGQLARALERSVVSIRVYGNPNFQYALMDALANSGTKDPAIHTTMIAMFEQPAHTDLPRKTLKALAKMGPVIIPSLKKAYPIKPAYVQKMIIRTLKTMKGTAKETVPWLKQIRKGAPVDMRDTIDDALEVIDR
jgi:TolB-like protein